MNTMEETPDTGEEQALPSYNEKINENDLPPKLKKLYLKADSSLETANYDYAIALLQGVLREQPDFLVGRRKLRRAAVRLKEAAKKGMTLGGESLKVMKIQGLAKKDPLAAIQALEKEVLVSDPYNAQGNQLLYEACDAVNLKLTAGYALETLTTGHPDNNKYFHQLGEYYMKEGEFEHASQVYMQIRERDPSDLVAIQQEKNATANHSMKQGGWDENASFEDLKKDKGEATKLDQANRAAMTPEMLRDRIAELGQLYAADQNDINVVKDLAKCYEELDEWETSLGYYEWAFSLSNNDPSLETKVAEIRERKVRQELGDLQTFVDQNPDHPDIEQHKARIAEMGLSQNEQLIEEARVRVERNPTDQQLRFGYGKHLFEGGRYRDAIQHLQQAKTSPNLRIKTMLMLGKCYDKMNMLDLAADQFEEAAKDVPSMDETKKDLLYNLGLLLERMDKKVESLEALKQIYAADYNYLDVAARVEGSYTAGSSDDAAGEA
jgi:tetratricopeptide (TPR) repeat protein